LQLIYPFLIMALSQKYLERLASRQRVSQQSHETPPPKTVSAEQMAQLDAAIKQQRIEQRKEGWRASAKWLEQNCEQYRQPGKGEVSNVTNETGSSIKCSNSEPANEPTTGELQPFANAPESPESALAALSAPSPIPLASAFWQALLYGSRDALVSPTDANTAQRLVACELAKDSDVVEFTDSVRVNTLRKMLDARFGAAEAWQAMNKLWRNAPASSGVPAPNEEVSQASPGVRDCPPSMPAWCREFHQEITNEQRLLESMGGWCG
jgi:hypothetical protein